MRYSLFFITSHKEHAIVGQSNDVEERKMKKQQIRQKQEMKF